MEEVEEEKVLRARVVLEVELLDPEDIETIRNDPTTLEWVPCAFTYVEVTLLDD